MITPMNPVTVRFSLDRAITRIDTALATCDDDKERAELVHDRDVFITLKKEIKS